MSEIKKAVMNPLGDLGHGWKAMLHEDIGYCITVRKSLLVMADSK